MTKLTELIREYKKSKTDNFPPELYELLNKIIKEKASYIFYNKPYSRTEFKLVDTKKITIEDIQNELWLEILYIIKKYDVKKEFEPYLYATLWKWQPEIISKKEHRQVLYTKTETELKKEDKQQMETETVTKEFQEGVDIDDLFQNLTDKERKFLELKSLHPEKNQTEIAKTLRVTQQAVSKLIKKLKRKLK